MVKKTNVSCKCMFNALFIQHQTTSWSKLHQETMTSWNPNGNSQPVSHLEIIWFMNVECVQLWLTVGIRWRGCSLWKSTQLSNPTAVRIPNWRLKDSRVVSKFGPRFDWQRDKTRRQGHMPRTGRTLSHHQATGARQAGQVEKMRGAGNKWKNMKQIGDEWEKQSGNLGKEMKEDTMEDYWKTRGPQFKKHWETWCLAFLFHLFRFVWRLFPTCLSILSFPFGSQPFFPLVSQLCPVVFHLSFRFWRVLHLSCSHRGLILLEVANSWAGH